MLLVQCILRQLQSQNMQVLPESLYDVKDSKLFEMQTARVSAQNQTRKSKLPPVMPETSSVGVFYVEHAADVLCALPSKLDRGVKNKYSYWTNCSGGTFCSFLATYNHSITIFFTGGSANWQ